MPDFVQNTAELASSVYAFNEAPEYWREAIGNYPKYFVHVDGESGPVFGLSKFCAFRGITLQDYVVDRLRSTTGGGTTQQHIKRISGKDWLPLNTVSNELRAQFSKWFTSITGGKLRLDDIHLMTIDGNVKVKKSLERELSPESLQEQLAAQAKIGQIGEKIAMAYEKNRLVALGAKKSNLDLEHVSLRNAAAGFDIRSSFRKEVRYIEVKASTIRNGQIYISLNEIRTLQRHGESAYLYIVHLTDVENKKGEVVKEINNPFIDGFDTEWISPALYAGKPPQNESPTDA